MRALQLGVNSVSQAADRKIQLVVPTGTVSPVQRPEGQRETMGEDKARSMPTRGKGIRGKDIYLILPFLLTTLNRSFQWAGVS